MGVLNEHLPREWVLSKTRKRITSEMNAAIPIMMIDNVNASTNSNSSTNERQVIEGGNRSTKDILNFVVPYLIQDDKLTSANPTIHLHISGDGCNVG